MTPWLSVICPTTGRPTLAWTLASVRRQAPATAVELVVVADTHGADFAATLAHVPALCARYDARYLEHDAGLHCVGQPQRQAGQEHATGEWLSWTADDDCYRPGAFAAIRRAVCGTPPAPHLFRLWQRWAPPLWNAPVLAVGNIDANCLVAPNVPGRLGHWQNFYAGDQAMIMETCERWNWMQYWQDALIGVIRPTSIAGIEWTRTE